MRAFRIMLALLCALGASVGYAAKITGGDTTFTVTVDTLVVYCAASNASSLCSSPQLVKAGVQTQCSDFQFRRGQASTGVAMACYTVDQVTSPATPFASCWPAFTKENYQFVKVPDSVNSPQPYLATWVNTCDGKPNGQFFTLSDITSLFVAYTAGLLGDSNAINAWVKAQPVETLTPSQKAWKTATLAALAPVTYTMWVQPIASGTRPYYKANSAGTAASTKLGDVAVKTDCDQAKRLGATNYYWVPSVNGYAVCIAKP